MRFTLICVALAAVLLLGLFAGCERKVINEQAAGVELTSCFTCHSDQDLALVVARQQFDYSVHASGQNVNRNRLNAGFYQACEQCHTSEGFLAKVTGVPATGEQFTAISCFTCHKPHTSGTLQLRVASAVTLPNDATYDYGKSDICASCHLGREDVADVVTADVTLSTHWGPHHSVQSDMLLGTNAYEYSDYTEGYTNAAHTSATKVKDGCVTCHMGISIHPSVGGHSVNMRNEDRGFQAYESCNQSGCHSGSPLSSLNPTGHGFNQDYDGNGSIDGIQTEIQGLLDTLKIYLIADTLLDSASGEPVDAHVVADSNAAGALFNYLYVHEDRSLGIHNLYYTVALLKSSINYMKTGDPNGMEVVEKADTRRKLTMR